VQFETNPWDPATAPKLWLRRHGKTTTG
jgi:hypothetical protein